jgi:hypothetical protein
MLTLLPSSSLQQDVVVDMQTNTVLVNGERISLEDPRLSPAYFAYYYLQRPLDPRLPPPLFNWSSLQYANQSRGDKELGITNGVDALSFAASQATAYALQQQGAQLSPAAPPMKAPEAGQGQGGADGAPAIKDGPLASAPAPGALQPLRSSEGAGAFSGHEAAKHVQAVIAPAAGVGGGVKHPHQHQHHHQHHHHQHQHQHHQQHQQHQQHHQLSISTTSPTGPVGVQALLSPPYASTLPTSPIPAMSLGPSSQAYLPGAHMPVRHQYPFTHSQQFQGGHGHGLLQTGHHPHPHPHMMGHAGHYLSAGQSPMLAVMGYGHVGIGQMGQIDQGFGVGFPPHGSYHAMRGQPAFFDNGQHYRNGLYSPRMQMPRGPRGAGGVKGEGGISPNNRKKTGGQRNNQPSQNYQQQQPPQQQQRAQGGQYNHHHHHQQQQQRRQKPPQAYLLGENRQSEPASASIAPPFEAPDAAASQGEAPPSATPSAAAPSAVPAVAEGASRSKTPSPSPSPSPSPRPELPSEQKQLPPVQPRGVQPAYQPTLLASIAGLSASSAKAERLEEFRQSKSSNFAFKVNDPFLCYVKISLHPLFVFSFIFILFLVVPYFFYCNITF